MDFERLMHTETPPILNQAIELVRHQRDTDEHAREAYILAREAAEPLHDFAKNLGSRNGIPLPFLVFLGNNSEGTPIYARAIWNGTEGKLDYEFRFFAGSTLIDWDEVSKIRDELEAGYKFGQIGLNTSEHQVTGLQCAEPEFIGDIYAGYSEQFESMEAVQARKTESDEKVAEIQNTIKMITVALQNPQLNPDAESQLPEIFAMIDVEQETQAV